MSTAAVENVMSTLTLISFVAAIAMLAVWLLAFGVRLAGPRILTRAASSQGGRRPGKDVLLSGMAQDPFGFLFDRSLPAAAAAAETGTRQSARESTTSADGSLGITLSSPSRREVEISLDGAHPPGTIAAVHFTDDSSKRWVLIPLMNFSRQDAGVAVVPTRSRQVVISRDVKFIRDADLGAFSAEDIGASVRSATGATRDRWQELLAMAQTNLTTIPASAQTVISAALKRH